MREAVLSRAEALLREGIGADYFLRMKRSALGRRIKGLDSFDGTCFRLCAYHFAGFDYFRFPAIYQDITPEEVLAFLARVVKPDRFVPCPLLILWPNPQYNTALGTAVIFFTFLRRSFFMNPANYSVISFPALGISLNPPRGFSVGPLYIHFYGLIIACGLMLAVYYACKRSRQAGLDEDTLLDGVLWVTPFTILCARAYYCAFSLPCIKITPFPCCTSGRAGLPSTAACWARPLAWRCSAKSKSVPSLPCWIL